MFGDLGEILGGHLDSLARLDPALIVLATYVLLAVDTALFVGLIMPGDAIVLLAGTTVTDVGSYAAITGFGTLGALTGGSSGYLLGRVYGGRLRHTRLGRRIGTRHWTRAERLFQEGAGGWGVAFAYFLPWVHTMTPVIAGTLRMPYPRFVMFAGMGSFAWIATHVALGSLIGSAVRAHQGTFTLVIAVAALCLVAAAKAVAHLIRRRRLARRNTSARRPSGRGGRPFSLRVRPTTGRRPSRRRPRTPG